MTVHSYWPNPHSWGHYWPARIISLIAVIQLLVSFIILGIHGGIVGIGVAAFCIGATPWFVMGFVCWAFFFACWISIFCTTCCNRSSVGCATYSMIKNILAFIFAAVLIDFDRKFINGEIAEYWYLYSDNFLLCNGNYLNSQTQNLPDITLGLVKGQLAGAVIILVSALVFVGIYVYVYIRAVRDGQMMPDNTFRANDHPLQQPQLQGTVRYNANPSTVICPRCGSPVDIPARF